MVFIFDGLKRATPDMLTELAVPMFALIAIGIFGMYVFSFIAGKLVGVSPAMAFACSLTALYGFPADYVITKEVINTLTDDQDERELLTAHMLPPMLVAGFVTVTMVSVVMAGIFVGFWCKFFADRIQSMIEGLDQFTATPGAGTTRFTFSPEFRQAIICVQNAGGWPCGARRCGRQSLRSLVSNTILNRSLSARILTLSMAAN